MTLLRVDASMGDRSASSALAELVLDGFVAARPEVPVARRHLGQDPLPAARVAGGGGTAAPTTCAGSSSTSGAPTSPWWSASSPSSGPTPRSMSSPRRLC